MFGGRTASPPTGVSVIGEQLLVRGDLDTSGTVRVDGQVVGTLHRAGVLVVGASGTVVGDVEAREVVVAGTLNGNVAARGRIEIESTARVEGEIRAATMVLRPGGVVNGILAIGGQPQAPSATGRHLDLSPPQPQPVASRSKG